MILEKNTTQLEAFQKDVLKYSQKLLPHYAPYGIHLLEGTAAICAWAQKHNWPTDSFPTKRINWAVGIDHCAHRRLIYGLGQTDPSQAGPGLFSISPKALTMEWRSGKSTPVRIGGTNPMRMPIEFIFWITSNNATPDAPASPNTFKHFSDEELDNWTLAQANSWR